MSNADQYPTTTKGETKQPGKGELASVRRQLATAGGVPIWRSLDEAADTAHFRDFVEREFTAGATEFSRAMAQGGDTRRDFLKLIGASVALAGAATIPGCRRPDHTIMPYSANAPEDVIPGKPLYFATSMPRPDGGAEGLLVETHEGRPTKIEGNPLHPANRGRVSTWAMASILSLYDPDRLMVPVYKNPAKGRVNATWDDFRAWAGSHFAKYDAAQGEGLAFIADKTSSPTFAAMKAKVLARWPKAAWVAWSPAQSSAPIEGTRLAFGSPMREVLNISKQNTRVILSLDRDFVTREAGEVANARGFAASRDLASTKDDMSRLYMVESGFSLTGGQADHRLRLAPSRVSAFAVELARFLLPMLSQPGAQAVTSALASFTGDTGDIDRNFLEACAKDLADAANRGKTLIVAGDSLPGPVHALVCALNAALGNIGASVAYYPMGEDEAADSRTGLAGLAAKLKAHAVNTVVCVGANPVYDAPGDLGFAELYKSCPTTLCLSVDSTETAAASTWSLNAASYLESWGDTLALDGTLAPVQPMIAPIYEPAMSPIEFLALLASTDSTARIDGYEIVRAQWRARLGEGRFEQAWRRALHDGVLPGSATTVMAPTLDFGGVVRGLGTLTLNAAPTAQALDVVFRVGNPGDGRWANIPWLQELPEAATRTVWDNPILMAPATAEAMGLLPTGYSHKDPDGAYTKTNYPEAVQADVTIDGRTVRGAVWLLPGMAENTAICVLGYGRDDCGKVGDRVGFNFYPLVGSGFGVNAARGTITPQPDAGAYMIVSTQNNWAITGRDSLVRVVDLPAWKAFGDEIDSRVDGMYGTKADLNFAERLGELSHTPANISIYNNPYNKGPENAQPGSAYSKDQQWAMTIDQQTCTGCGACTIACQSENNIPVVGKKEVAKGREMTWIRVDRYFAGTDFNDPSAMHHQPVACVHCENAPCETVCPVNATVHGPEGINYMVYNRCIGTRYCANNCPYKVRRYNFFEYGWHKFNGDYYFKGAIEAVAPDRGGITGSGKHNKVNPNLIPPRLRQKLDDITKMQQNPDVSVRSRGVMEKCSYCIQRINAARYETRLKGLDKVPDGFFQTACQQACPSGSITFGDMLDAQSQVARTRAHPRSYLLLGYVNTRPRTSHMLRVMNPNPALCDAARKHRWEHPFHHGPAGGHDEKGHAVRTPGRDREKGRPISLRVLPGVHA